MDQAWSWDAAAAASLDLLGEIQPRLHILSALRDGGPVGTRGPLAAVLLYDAYVGIAYSCQPEEGVLPASRQKPDKLVPTIAGLWRRASATAS